MSKVSRTEIRVYETAVREGWDIPAEKRAEAIEVLSTIMHDATVGRRDRMAAARALLQPSRGEVPALRAELDALRAELDALRAAHGTQYEELVHRLRAIESKPETDAGPADAAVGD
jgi:hypothetical protein